MLKFFRKHKVLLVRIMAVLLLIAMIVPMFASLL